MGYSEDTPVRVWVGGICIGLIFILALITMIIVIADSVAIGRLSNQISSSASTAQLSTGLMASIVGAHVARNVIGN